MMEQGEREMFTQGVTYPDGYDVLTDEYVLDLEDVQCPVCGAEPGEECTIWCDDEVMGTVRSKREAFGWDDEA